MPTLRAVKGDSVSEEPVVRHVTLRGVAYTVTELSVVEYDECLAAAEDEKGEAQFGQLLRQMVLRSVSPSPATRRTPLPFPIYRTLERIVNEVHFTDVTDEGSPDVEEPTTPNESSLPTD